MSERKNTLKGDKGHVKYPLSKADPGELDRHTSDAGEALQVQVGGSTAT